MGKVIKFRPSLSPHPLGKVPVYRWQIDSNYKPWDEGEAWDVAGYRDELPKAR